ncbi:MAG: DUF6020 family protein [Erysipelotrichales bacterium]|nr:DUF6020 family protein [Erysipelotrichales bacterium]
MKLLELLNCNRRKFIYVTLFSFILLFSLISGFILESNSYISFTFLILIIYLILVFLISICFAMLSLFILRYTKKYSITFKKTWFIQKFKYNKLTPLYIFFIIFITWIPILLAYYPGVWSYDVGTQLFQLENNVITKYQPILHTLLIGGFTEIGKSLFDSYSFGVLLYSLFQMLLLCSSFTYLDMYILRDKKINIFIFILILIFQCLFPANPIMGISSTKDTIFSALTIYLVVYLLKILENKSGIDKKEIIIFSLITALWVSFRNNALIAYIPFSIILISIMFKHTKKILLLVISSLITCFLMNYSIDFFIKPGTYSSIEVLSVPINQISYSMIVDFNDLEDELNPMFIKIFGDSYLKYNPYLSDPVKSNMNFSIGDMGNFIRIWIDLLPKAFDNYVIAFAKLNIGSWYIFDDSYANIYQDKYYNGKLLENSHKVHQKGYLQTELDSTLGFSYQTKIKPLFNCYEEIISNNIYTKSLIGRILFSPAMYLMITFASLLFNLYRKRYIESSILSLLIFYWLTLLLGPCALVRYMYPIISLAPLSLSLIISGSPNYFEVNK